MKRNKFNWTGAAGALAGLVAMTAMPHGAQAIPSFAAQTGMPCSACHIGFPQLTPFGRAFKMDGYVQGGTFPDVKNFAAMQPHRHAS